MTASLDYLSSAAGIILPAIVSISIYFVYVLLKYGSRDPLMPPGPRTLPVLGNLTIFPRKYLHLQFSEWAKQYGDVFSLKVMNQSVIVLNSPSAMKEVIDKHSLSTSNRPKSTIADGITPGNMNLGTGHYANETWKVLRKSAAQLLSNESIRSRSNYQRAEAIQLMWDFVHRPDAWYQHIQRFTASYALGIVYGKRSPRIESPDVADFLHVHPQFLHALEFGTMPPVDLFPILTLVPERWAHWKRVVRHVRMLHETMYDRLLTVVENRLKNGQQNGSFMEEAIQKATEWGLSKRDLLLHLGGVILEGSDTSSASLQNVVLCLVVFPEAQRKAREEIDRVVGEDRVPTWEDIPNLPYTMALIDECTRFRPVGPLGLPHEMNRDETINGVLFPKNSVVFANLWHIFHDERYFDDPETFIPERFLDQPFGVKAGILDDPARRANMLFGGGRRVCPGIAFAKSSLEINTANLIWGFEFLPAVDSQTGQAVYPDLNDYTSGITATPKPAKIVIKPRSARHVEIIQSEFTSASEELKPYELELVAEDREFNATYRDLESTN